MFPHRPRHPICRPSRGPPFGLFPRHRWYSQRENGTTPYTCERCLVNGLGTPNLHQVATTWPNYIHLELRNTAALFCISRSRSALGSRRSLSFRAVWGTDWTRAFAVVNYEQAVEAFRRIDRLSDSEAPNADGRGLRQRRARPHALRRHVAGVALTRRATAPYPWACNTPGRTLWRDRRGCPCERQQEHNKILCFSYARGRGRRT